MNGGRLSDDAAFLLGMAELRAHLGAPSGPASSGPASSGPHDAADRALVRIAVRYPEHADELRQLLATNNHAGCLLRLDLVEAEFECDAEEP